MTTSHPALVLVLPLLASVALSVTTVGCRDAGDGPREIERSRLQPTQPLEESAAPTADARMEDTAVRIFVRAPDASGPGDVRADYRACVAYVDETTGGRPGNPLVRVARLRDCMHDRGWEMDPDAVVPEG